MRLSANVSPPLSSPMRPTRKLDYRMLIEMCNGSFRPENPILLIQFAYLCGRNVALPKLLELFDLMRFPFERCAFFFWRRQSRKCLSRKERRKKYVESDSGILRNFDYR